MLQELSRLLNPFARFANLKRPVSHMTPTLVLTYTDSLLTIRRCQHPPSLQSLNQHDRFTYRRIPDPRRCQNAPSGAHLPTDGCLAHNQQAIVYLQTAVWYTGGVKILPGVDLPTAAWHLGAPKTLLKGLTLLPRAARLRQLFAQSIKFGKHLSLLHNKFVSKLYKSRMR